MSQTHEDDFGYNSVNAQGFTYNHAMKRYTNECDCCQYPMTEKEFNVAVACNCDLCNPWILCVSCHEQSKKVRELRTALVDLGG